MRTALAKFGILGLRTTAWAAAIALGLAAPGTAMGTATGAALQPTDASPVGLESPATKAVAIGVIDVPGHHNGATGAANIDHVLEISLSDKLQIKAAVETFIWGLSNRQSSAVWLMAPEVEQAKLDSADAAYAFFTRIHPPLAHAKSVVFDSITASGNMPVANIYVTDTAGLQWRASFVMAATSSGDWKIAGCRLLPAPGNLV